MISQQIRKYFQGGGGGGGGKFWQENVDTFSTLNFENEQNL